MKRVTLVLVIMLSALLIASVGPALAKKKGKKGKGGGSAAGAAVAKGNILLGGSVDFSLASGTETIEPDQGDDMDTKVFRFGMDALAGYFMMRSLEVGGILIVDRETEDEDSGETVATTWAIGPQVGYFYPLTPKLSVFGLLPIGYAKTTEEFNPDAAGAKDQEMEHGGLFFEPRGGAVYHVNRSVGLAAALFFRYYSGSGSADQGAGDNDFDIKETLFGLKLGLFGFL